MRHGGILRHCWGVAEMMIRVIESPVGPLRITVEEGCVTGLEFAEFHTPDAKRAGAGDIGDRDLCVLEQAASELERYFTGELREFAVPVKLSGTPFQDRVWNAMRRIGYGETVTYQELARAAGSPRAARAVGNACAANPVAIVVPCHRVVAGSGLGGFGGGIDAKVWLLSLEGGLPQ